MARSAQRKRKRTNQRFLSHCLDVQRLKRASRAKDLEFKSRAGRNIHSLLATASTSTQVTVEMGTVNSLHASA